MTKEQIMLWEVADAKLQSLGGPGRLAHDPDMRQQARVQGSVVWAINEARAAVHGIMPDIPTCQYLIDCINGRGEKWN